MEKDPNKVKDWPIIGVRVDPKLKEDFEKQLTENKDTQSHALRRLIRNYTKG
jgi:hypothetical protein